MDIHEAGVTVRTLERGLERTPTDLAAHEQLAQAHMRLLQLPEREAELTAICRELPFAYTSQLHLAALADARGDKLDAVIGFFRAIRTAQLRGFWLDDGSTPPWLRKVVIHAMQSAQRGRADAFHQVLEPLDARYGKDELRRVHAALAMYLGLAPTTYNDPQQRPRFLYVPDLPRAPVFPREALALAEWYEAQTADILDELRARLAEDADGAPEVQPFHYAVAERERGQLVAGGAWDAYFFYKDGHRHDAHHAACPKTSAVLDALPLDHVRDHGPEVCYSIMRPGAHILPHRGVTNARAVLHLGLIVPDGCALNIVGVTEQTWQVGRCFAFDDTYEHEAWNRSATTRAVLLGDIWNPYLRPAECAALAELVATIGDFNRRVEPAPHARA